MHLNEDIKVFHVYERICETNLCVCVCVSILGEFEKYNLFAIKLSMTYEGVAVGLFQMHGKSTMIHQKDEVEQKNLLPISYPC